MDYKLIITEKAETLFDDLFYYLINNLKSHQAAKHLKTSVHNTYKRIQENPFQFPESGDPYLAMTNYREAPLRNMHYIVIYKVKGTNIYIEGIYHRLELYSSKIDS